MGGLVQKRAALRNRVLSVIRTGADEAHACIQEPFVGIDLLGQELRLAPFPLALPVFRGLAEHQFVELILPWLAPFGEPTPQRHTGAGRARYEPLSLVDNVTLDQAHHFASANHSGPCAKLRLPYRPQEIDL